MTSLSFHEQDRAYELHKLGAVVYYESLCNEQFLKDIFQRHRFTHVIHVAAQAGVRYSLTAPLTYVTANVECQVAIFEAVANYQQVKYCPHFVIRYM